MNQLQINLDFSLIHRENNIESQRHFEQNKDKFSAQCKKVYELLLEGKRLTVLDAMTKHGISSLPRRILDLKLMGAKIRDEFVIENGKTKYKEYFL